MEARASDTSLSMAFFMVSPSESSESSWSFFEGMRSSAKRSSMRWASLVASKGFSISSSSFSRSSRSVESSVWKRVSTSSSFGEMAISVLGGEGWLALDFEVREARGDDGGSFGLGRDLP